MSAAAVTSQRPVAIFDVCGRESVAVVNLLYLSVKITIPISKVTSCSVDYQLMFGKVVVVKAI